MSTFNLSPCMVDDIVLGGARGGAVNRIPFLRMRTEDIADRRKLFQLLTSIKNRAVSDNNRSLASIADETIDLWTRMEAATLAAAQEELVANKAQCVSLQAALNDANEELDALRRKLSETENKLAESEAAEDIVIQKKGPDRVAAIAGAMPNPKRSTAVVVSDEEGLEMWQGKNDSLNSHGSTVGSGLYNNIASLGPRGVQPSPLLGHSIEFPPFGTMSRFDVPHGAWRGDELGMRMPTEVHGNWKQCVEYPTAPPQIPKQSPRSISHDILHNGHAPTLLSSPRPNYQSPRTNFISLLDNPADAIPHVEQAHGNWQPGIEYPAAPPFNFKTQMQSPERTFVFRRVPPAFEIKHQLGLVSHANMLTDKEEVSHMRHRSPGVRDLSPQSPLRLLSPRLHPGTSPVPIRAASPMHTYDIPTMQHSNPAASPMQTHTIPTMHHSTRWDTPPPDFALIEADLVYTSLDPASAVPASINSDWLNFLHRQDW